MSELDVVNTLRAERDQARCERDELLLACQAVLHDLAASKEFDAGQELLRRAIAKATGK